jgi:hypothetical protein
MKGGKKLLDNRRSGQTIKHENRESAGRANTWNTNRPNPMAHNSVERVCSCRNGVVERTRFAPLRTMGSCNAFRDEFEESFLASINTPLGEQGRITITYNSYNLTVSESILLSSRFYLLLA